MRSSTPPTMHVVKKEEKEPQLRAHIGSYLGALDGMAGEGHVFLLVVRSHESPVVRALANLAPDLCASGVRIDTIVAMPGNDLALNWPEELISISECRTLHDIRLLDAHEQLWLGDDAFWIGDCMRREPAKRDAYECHGTGHREGARSVWNAFKHFWAKAEPVRLAKVRPPEGAIVAALDEAVAALQAAEQTTPPLAATRH